MAQSVKRKRVAIPVALLIAIVAAVGAVAYFTASGSGDGNGSVGTSSPWTVSVNNATGGPIYPGAGSETFNFTVSNAGSGHQNLASVTAAVKADVPSGDVVGASGVVTGCKASWFVLGTPSVTTTGDFAPSASTTGSVSMTMTNTASNQDACKNAAPTITVSAS